MTKTPIAGYRRRPWELTVLAVFFALVPVLSWLTRYVSLVLNGQVPPLGGTLASFFSSAGNGPLGLAHAGLMALLWVLFLVVAWGIFRVAKWGFMLCIVAAVANTLFSTISYSFVGTPEGMKEQLNLTLFQELGPVMVGDETASTGFIFPLKWDFVLNLVFFIPVVVILNQKIMAPFFNPKLKWWEQHPRVKAMLSIEARFNDTARVYKSFDISASGMFLGTEEFPDLPVGGTFPATIRLEETGTSVEVLCKTVWISDGKGRAPMGVGVTFDYLKPGQKKDLGRYIKTRIKEGHLVERT